MSFRHRIYTPASNNFRFLSDVDNSSSVSSGGTVRRGEGSMKHVQLLYTHYIVDTWLIPPDKNRIALKGKVRQHNVTVRVPQQ